MYRVRETKRFRKSLIKIQRSGRLNQKIRDDIEYIVELLRAGKDLPQKFKDHSLIGDYRGFRECHIRFDLLLLYKIENDELILVLSDIGSHSYLSL